MENEIQKLQQSLAVVKAEAYDANKKAAFFEGFVASIGEALKVESGDMKDISSEVQKAIDVYLSSKEKDAGLEEEQHL